MQWDMSEGQSRPNWDRPTHVTALALSSEGKRMAMVRGTEVEMNEAEMGRRVLTLDDHRAAVTHVVFSESGERLATADSSGVIRIRMSKRAAERQ